MRLGLLIAALVAGAAWLVAVRTTSALGRVHPIVRTSEGSPEAG